MSFKGHTVKCDSCKRFDPEKSSTLALLCLEGAKLWKSENTFTPKREPIIRPVHHATKAQVKAAMRYK